jgi:hypothetical protein
LYDFALNAVMQVSAYDPLIPRRWPSGGGYGKVSRPFSTTFFDSVFVVFVSPFLVLA